MVIGLMKIVANMVAQIVVEIVMKIPPSQEIIDEWVDSPVTGYLRYLITKELEFFEKVDVFFRSDPQKTQEALLEMITEVSTFQRVQEALKGDFSEFSSEDDSEPE